MKSPRPDELPVSKASDALVPNSYAASVKLDDCEWHIRLLLILANFQCFILFYSSFVKKFKIIENKIEKKTTTTTTKNA